MGGLTHTLQRSKYKKPKVKAFVKLVQGIKGGVGNGIPTGYCHGQGKSHGI